MRYYSNIAVRTTLDNSGGINTSATSIEIDDNTGWPTSFPFTMRINPNSTNEEIVTVNSGSGTSGSPYVVTRAADGTTAKTHSQGSTVVHSVSARDLKEPQDHIADLTIHNPIYATTAARDSAIPSPTAGQLAFVTGTGESYLYTGTAWVGTRPRIVVKPSDTLRSSTITPTDDPHLTLAVEANSKYLISGLFRFISGTTAGDVRMEFASPASTTLFVPGFGAHLETTSNTPGKVVMLDESSVNSAIDLTSASSPFGVSITNGLVVVAGTAGNVTLQWSQNVSNATATTLQANSYISLLKIA